MRGIINKGEIFVMEFIEVSAKTVNDAITDALVQLGVTSDQLEYEVVSEGSSGFLGFGSKPALIPPICTWVYRFAYRVAVTAPLPAVKSTALKSTLSRTSMRCARI